MYGPSAKHPGRRRERRRAGSGGSGDGDDGDGGDGDDGNGEDGKGCDSGDSGGGSGGMATTAAMSTVAGTGRTYVWERETVGGKRRQCVGRGNRLSRGDLSTGRVSGYISPCTTSAKPTHPRCGHRIGDCDRARARARARGTVLRAEGSLAPGQASPGITRLPELHIVEGILFNFPTKVEY